jgi:hypothetical protein
LVVNARFMLPDMSDSIGNLDAVTVLAALANAQRWQMVGLMSRGEALTINGLVKTSGRSYKAVHKDMKVLWSSGAVACRYGEDKRVGIFYVPEQYRPQPGVVDYGFCAVRFGDAAKPAERIPVAKD